MQSASIARGLAGIAMVAVAVVAVRAALAVLAEKPPVARSVCAVPVEHVSARGARLACASDPVLRSCPDLRRGDRVSHDCRVDRGGMAAVTRLVAGLPLDINRASAADLELLVGIGPKLAEAIVTERAVATFASVGELVRVRGIGAGKLDALRPYIMVAPQ